MAFNEEKWNEFLTLRIRVLYGSLPEIEAPYEQLKTLAAEVAPGFLDDDETWKIEEAIKRERSVKRLKDEFGDTPSREDLIALLEKTLPPKTKHFDPVEFDAAISFIHQNVPHPNFGSLCGPLFLDQKTVAEVIDEALAHQSGRVEGAGFVLRR